MSNSNQGQGGDNSGPGGGNSGPGGGGNNEITIHIDKNQYKSPSPTTGAALYALGHVAAGYDLWREVHGKGDDEMIANSTAAVVLKNGDHFYTAQSSLNPGADRVGG